MATKSQVEAMNLYANLVAEMRLRIDIIQKATAGSTGLIAPLVKEFCYLQLRMLCELIALGCLVAHGDIKATTKLKGEWSAKEIIRRLGQLQPDFFPSPQIIKPSTNPAYINEIHGPKGRNIDYLTKEELINLNGKCGTIVHRGSLKKLLSESVSIQLHFPDIDAHLTKIRNLLRTHAIFLSDQKTMIFCDMENIDKKGGIKIFEKIGQLPLP